MRRVNRRRGEGFTIVELLIASAVFSIVSLVALTSFVEIGRLFYRGAVYTANQQSARGVVSRVIGDISNSSQISDITAVGNSKPDTYYYCIGSNRYTFVLGKKLSLDEENQERANKDPSNWSNFGLLRDHFNSFSDCNNPFGGASSTPLSQSASELLGNNMRINQFCVKQNLQQNSKQQTYGNLYQVIVDLATGDNNVLKLTTLTTPGCGQYAHPATCDTTLKTSQFCAQNSLSSSVAAVSSTNAQKVSEDVEADTTYTLSIRASGGVGSLYLDGTLCDNSGCTQDYPVAEPEYATVQAIPDYTNYKFTGWSGTSACNNPKAKNSVKFFNPCTFKVDDNIGLVANFTRK